MQMPRAAAMLHLSGLLLAIVIFLSRSEAQVSISCATVSVELSPCISFLQRGGPNQPLQACCKAVKTLSGEAGSQQNRTAICECIKQGLARVGNYDPQRIPQLPPACGMSLILPPIDNNTDCSKIVMKNNAPWNAHSRDAATGN